MRTISPTHWGTVTVTVKSEGQEASADDENAEVTGPRTRRSNQENLYIVDCAAIVDQDLSFLNMDE